MCVVYHNAVHVYTYNVIVIGNGGGSGGRICIDLWEDLRFMGTLSALGGASSTRNGSPGSVWVNSTVGADVVTHLWADNLNRGWGCEKFPINVDVKYITNFHPMRGACIRPTAVSYRFNCIFT